MKLDSQHKSHPPQEKPLVSVERQYETDIATGRTETRMFVKMYFAARDSGLLADIGDRRWRTLCCLATYMDENGRCWPSQDTIARDLGLKRQRANERIQDLASYRFEGRPVIRIVKRRVPSKHGGRFANNSYEILPIAGLGIFDRKPMSGKPDTGIHDSPMSGKSDKGHRPVSVVTVTETPDTNQNQSENQTFNVRRAGSKSSQDAPRIDRGPTSIGESLPGYLVDLRSHSASQGEIEALAIRIEEVTGDRHSRRRFLAIAQRVPKSVIEQTLASIKSAGDQLRNRGAFFEKCIQAECQALDIELPSARQGPHAPAEGSTSCRSSSEFVDGQDQADA